MEACSQNKSTHASASIAYQESDATDPSLQANAEHTSIFFHTVNCRWLTNHVTMTIKPISVMPSNAATVIHAVYDLH